MPGTQVVTPEVETEAVNKEVVSPVKKSVVEEAEQAVTETGDSPVDEKIVEKVVEKADAESATVDEAVEQKEENGKAAPVDEEDESQDSLNGDSAVSTNGSTKEPVDEESNEVEETEVESSKRKSIAEEEPEVSPKKQKTDAEPVEESAEESVTTSV